MGTIAIGVYSLFLTFARLDVPYYDQTVRYQTACESVATVACLNYLGYDVTIDEFLDRYLPRIEVNDPRVENSDFNIFDRYFVGNPRTYAGWLCHPPVIVEAVRRYFFEAGVTDRSAVDNTGHDLNLLLEGVLNGYPCVIWVTADYEPSEIVDLKGNEYMANNHAVVISGYDRNRGIVLITDSLKGVIEVEYYKLQIVFALAGKRCVVIR